MGTILISLMVVVLGSIMLPADVEDSSVSMQVEPQESRSGCCSWHGGVCGCSGGRVVCCDGTTSPSCTC